jgi:hypothetical protein
MSRVNRLPSEECAIVGVIDPDAYAANTYTTAFVEVSKFRRFQAIIMAGDLGSSATLDAKLQRASDASGTSAEDITGTSITQLTQAGTDSNKQVIINYDTQNEVGNAKRFIGLSITVGTATSDAGALLLGFDPFFSPASDSDAASVDEIKSV